MRLQRGVEPLPQLDILDRLLVGGAPAVLLPAVDPAGDALPHILAVGGEVDDARLLQRFQRRDRRHQLHAVVGGVRLAALQFLFVVAELQDRAPAAGPGIARAGAVGEDRDVRQFAHATSPGWRHAVIAHAGDALVEAQLADIFQRVLRLHQRARRHVEQVDQPRQQETQRRAARQQRQRLLLGVGQLPLAAIGVEQRARLGDVEGMIRLETPGVQADRDVIGQHVVAGEREVDQPRQLVAEEEHVVGKQIGVDHAVRQIVRPAPLRGDRARAR